MIPTFDQVLSQALALPLMDRIRLASLLIQWDRTPVISVEERRARIRKFRGKYKYLFSSVDEFMARKREEVELEERRYEERQRRREGIEQ